MIPKYYERHTEMICKCGHELHVHANGQQCQAEGPGYQCPCSQYENQKLNRDRTMTKPTKFALLLLLIGLVGHLHASTVPAPPLAGDIVVTFESTGAEVTFDFDGQGQVVAHVKLHPGFDQGVYQTFNDGATIAVFDQGQVRVDLHPVGDHYDVLMSNANGTVTYGRGVRP